MLHNADHFPIVIDDDVTDDEEDVFDLEEEDPNAQLDPADLDLLGHFVADRKRDFEDMFRW